jgi:transcriptional regulator with XRE-family HTH domain
MRERKYAADLDGLGAFIRERRRALDLTQSQLADRLGWVQERISLLEHGKYGTPSLPLFASLAEALEVDQAALLSAAGFLSSSGDPVSGVEFEIRSKPHRASAADQSEVLTAGEFSQASVELVSQVERLHAGLVAAETQMQKVDNLRIQLAARRRQLSELSEELQTALQPDVN